MSNSTASPALRMVKGYGASGDLIGGKTLKLIAIERRQPSADEVLIEILYCGVCHSDLHQINNDWKNTIYPCVPGHEIIGKVTEIGSSVSEFKIGQTVGVGCMIDSCRNCESCKKGEEQYCTGPVGATMTYNGYLKPDGSGFNTFGGYSSHIISNKAFVLRIPESLKASAVAPILCAGVTTYSPLKKQGIKAGDKVGIVGIGGLGHMGVMIAKSMGATVTAITSKEEKRRLATELGADSTLVWEDKKVMEANEATLDFILVTIPYSFDVNPFVKLLKPHGNLITVGLLGPYEKPVDNNEAAMKNRTIGGSLIGGIAETQEVLDFCAKHSILPHVEMIEIEKINEALEKVKNEEVRFRYVIDMKSLK